ncbi:MAG: protein-disulfide reductase DsbD N-terminal domain-containing protein [Bacteroidales bacterium]|jgi:vacuolar-type H+-ATPase subunit F/Vma7|nr:protein-disulfide reductase DsbD N-terminal domain-containing protein [Bacteroidales bacterium]
MTKKKILIFTIFFSVNVIVSAQENHVKWIVSEIQTEQDSNVIIINAKIAENWYIYGMNIEEGGPLPLIIELFDEKDEIISGKVYEISKSHVKYDEVFKMKVETFDTEAMFKYVFRLPEGMKKMKLVIDGQACNTKDGACLPIYENIEIIL